MKTKLTILKFLIILCGTFATTAAFGQVTQIWTGGNGTGIELGAATNWGGTLPLTANSDTGQWNGSVPGPLNLLYNSGTLASGFGSSGVNLHLTAAQTSPVSINSTNLGFSSPLAILGITIESGAGAFSVGNTVSTSTLNWVGRPAGADHLLQNDSANTATLNPYIQFTAGGGTAWTLHFLGAGNWQCNSYLVNNNGPTMNIQVDGPGTMTWNPTGYLGANGLTSPILINGGALVLAGSHPKLSNQAITMNGNFTFNAPSQAQTLSGVISGGGTNTVIAGTLTLSGQSTYTGNTILSGGELIVNGAENAGTSGPLGLGTISFTGGMLGFSLNNTFDYSARFDTTAGQKYSFDTAGQSVTFTNSTGLTSSGGTLTKIGAGTLTLAGLSIYSGLTTVSAGKLVFQGSKTGSGNITVADGAALGVTATGTQITPGTLTVGTSSGATLEFNNVNSTTSAPFAPVTLSSAGTITINVNSGPLAPGNSYPLLAWTSGSAPGVSLGVLNGFIGNLSTNGTSIQLNVTATAYKWTGNTSSSWDLITANNWVQNGGPVVFANGGPVLFDDTSAQTNVTITGIVQPTTITVNIDTAIYSITSSAGNAIGGSASVTKSGSSTLTLSGGANTNTGITTISGGTLSVGTLANGGAASDIGASSSGATNLVINGGTLQYTGGAASVDRLFSVGTSGGAIDASGTGALNLANTAAIGYSGNGSRTLTLTGTLVDTNTLAAAIGNNGGATALTKNGAGNWVLTGANTYSGLTTVNGGVLQIGAGGASGSFGTGNIVNNGRIDFQRTGSLTVGGVISGTGAVTNDGSGTVILAGNNTYSGGTTINAGTLQIGNGGVTGNLSPDGAVVDNATLIFNTTGNVLLSGFNAHIRGTGNVIVRGAGGLVRSISGNDYTGWTLIDTNATFQPCIGNASSLSTSVTTNYGTLLLIRQDGNPLPVVFAVTNNIVGSGRVVKDNNNQNEGWVGLFGTNTYTGGTFIAGGGIVLGDGVTPGAGSIVGTVWFTNTASAFDNPRRLIFDRPEDFTFTNDIISVVTVTANGFRGAVEQDGAGTVTLTGNNNIPAGVTITAGALQFGNGGTSGGSPANGNVTDNGVLILNHSDNLTLGGIISGSGSVVQQGSGTLTLSNTNTYTGATTVSNGTLVVTRGVVGGDMNVMSGATLAPAAIGSIGTLSVGGALNITSGTLLVSLNKALSPSNSTFTANSGVNSTGGTLKLVNYGSNLVIGDTFTIFSGAVSGITTIVSPGFTVANNIAVDGSVTVSSILPPPTITTTVSGGNLTLTWPAAWTGGVHVQSQTNTLSKGLSTNWVTIPGTDASNSYTNTINKTNGSVFYRLITP